MPGEGRTVGGATRAQIDEAQSTWWGRIKLFFWILPPERSPARSDCPCRCGRFEPHAPQQLALPAPLKMLPAPSLQLTKAKVLVG